MLIAAADKIDNIESKIEAFEKEGVALLTRWKQPVESYLWYHGEVLRIVRERLSEHPLTARLAEAHARERKIFSEE